MVAMEGKIVVPLDGSTLAETALPLAIKLAKFTGTRLLLLRVTVLPVELEAAFAEENPAHLLPLPYLEKVRADLTNPAKYPAFTPDRVEVMVSRGNFTYEIPEIAQAEGGSLIVMTTHGLAGFTQLLLDGVTRQVLRNSNLPVIVLRPDLVEAHKEDTSASEPISSGQLPLTIAVPLDGEAVSEAALEPACRLAEKLGAGVKLIRVVKPVQPILLDAPVMEILHPDGEQSEELHYRLEEAAHYLAQLKEKVVANWKNVTFETEVLTGDPAERLVEWAKEEEPFLIALATHARGGVGQILLGSVADEILRKGACPVLLVHIKKGYQGWKPRALEIPVLS